MSKFKGKPVKSNTTVKEVLECGQTSFDIPDRGITKGTIEHFGIRVMYNELDQTIDGYFFPVTMKGKVTGFIKYSPQRSKKNGRFTTVGDVSVDHELLGQVNASKGKKLFITEGFFDCLSAWQSLNNNKPSGFTGVPSVVSPALGIGDINKGATNSRQHIASNIDFVSRYDVPVVCFDNDSSGDVNVGQEGVQDMALVLKEFKNCILPVNDCNDMMMENGERELYFALQTAEDYVHGSIVQGVGDRESLLVPLTKGVRVESLPRTMGMLHGLRESELIIMLAPPKCGKTTLCKLIHYELMTKKIPTLGIYLEEGIRKTKQSFIALHAGVHLPKFRADPSCANKEKVQEAMDMLDEKHVMFFDDVKGRMTPSNVLSQLEWAYMKGARFAILDHLSFVLSGDKSGNNERLAIDQLLTDIAAFVKKTTMSILVVAHITRDKNKPKPKNKDGSIAYPYWYEVESDDGRGSGAFEQVCTTMIAIDKQIIEGGGRGLTRTKVLLNREWDLTGLGDKLTMNKQSGKLQVAAEDEY